MSQVSQIHPELVLLSAQSVRPLERMAAELVAFLEGPLAAGPRYSLANIAYTLQVGRDAMAERLAIPAASLGELLDGLRRFLDGRSDGLFRGKAPRRRPEITEEDEDAELAAIEGGLVRRDLHCLAEAWIAGRPVDWRRLHDASPSRHRVSLPSYPFDLQRCWITESRGAKAAATPQGSPSSARARQPADSASIETQVRARPMPVDPAPLPSDSSSQDAPKIRLTPVRAMLEGPPAPVPAVAAPPADAVTPTAPASRSATSERPRLSEAQLLDELRQSLADALFVEVADLDPDQTFVDVGVDSLVGVDWIRALNTRYNVVVKVTKIYDYPTLRDFAEFLAEEIASGGSAIEGDDATDEAAPPPQLRAAQPGAVAPIPPEPAVAPASLGGRLVADLADILRVPTERLAEDWDWERLGVDAAARGRLSQRVLERHGVRITDVDMLHFPSPHELGRLIEALVARGVEAFEPPPQAPTPVTPPAAGGDRALVISNVAQVGEVALSPWRTAALAAGEVRIEVRASAVNYPDVMCVNGLYPTMPDYPFVPGFEVAGVVVETAAGVTSLAVGDEVVAMTGQLLGGHAPFVNVPAGQVVRKPRNVTFEQACSLPVCFSTVYTAFELGRLQARERVLIQTATGGCGLVAIQLAKLRGCEVFATSSKTHKRQILETLGASFVTDYREAFDREIRSATAGRGVDLVLNMVSGPAMQRGLNSLAPSGRYVELAVHAQRTGKPLDLSRLVDNQSFHSLDMRRLGARSSDNEDVGRVLRLMVEMVEAGQLEPIASRIYPLGLIREALELVAAGEHVGKIVISHTATAIQDCEAACLEAIRAQGRRAGASPSGAQLSGPLAASLATDAPRRAHEPVAIIGVAGQFPKSPDLGVFWDNLKHGENCVGDPPFARWGVNLDADGRPVSGGPPIYPHLGALEDAECFDPTFFNISPKEARLMDPQQRVFLQNCWTCIEEAGYAPSSLSGSRCGVYVGCAQSDYLQQAREAPGVHALMGASSSVLAARISYLLDLKGPCLAIDTACSSALVAISEACTSVATGNCDLALAGGVVVLSSSAFSQTLTDAGMLSPDGRCHTFDRSANGFVPCEGVGVVLLKRLSDALRDNDRIQGVIAGWGVNHDGKTNGMTAPSVVSQTALEREVHRRFGIDAATISYIEAHGTGTNLGDPIEVEGLIEAFRGAGAAPGSCALGSVKSNIGHALCAAGVAGVLKVVLALKHGQLPPTINYDTLNPEISLEGSPFYVNRALADWPGKQRRAGVNSFSYNGTNAHVVIETGPEPAARRPVATPADGHVAVLSARSEDQLQAYARLLLTHVRSAAQACHADDEAATLRDLVFTLQVGRDPLAERLAMVVGSLDDLEGKLTAYLSGQPLPAGLQRANAVEARRAAGLAQLSREERAGRMAAALAAGNQPALIAAWLAGEAVDWKRLHAGCDVRRVAAPTYPFERKRYWIYDQEAPVQPAAPAPPAPAADVRFAQLLTTVTR